MLEILAPVGGAESLTAALNAGADAVYLGAKSFSARKNADNFDSDELKEAVKLCHISGVKVNIALNTLLYDEELPDFRRAVQDAVNAGVDAAIVQDLAAAKIIKDEFPTLSLHASTQMTITSVSGAEAAKKLGFKRVVLARELSLDEITEIVQKVDIETEVFVHGALCVCVSGQCYMSAMLGSRSGNRGLCAQPCRLNFTEGRRENVLSLKDLSIIENLPELQRLGVTSAKIEGRMKRAEYVAAAVNACRTALSGETPDIATLKAVFSRSGFTDGYFTNDYRNMSGIRTKEDVAASTSALSALKGLYDKPYKRRKISFTLTVTNGEKACLDAVCGEITASVFGDIPEKALNKPLTADYAEKQLTKLGGTVFEADGFSSKIDEELTLSASTLNSMRRKAVEIITEKLTDKDK